MSEGRRKEGQSLRQYAATTRGGLTRTAAFLRALKDLKNVEVKYMEEERYKKVDLKGVFLKEWETLRRGLSADVLINVPSPSIIR